MIDPEIDLLKARVAYLEELCEQLLCLQWDQRGQYKGISSKIETRLERHWNRHLSEVTKSEKSHLTDQ